MSLETVLDALPGMGTQCVEMGKIKIGGKSANARQSKSGGTWRAPEKYDHFVITTLQRGSNDDLIVDHTLMEELIGQYGDEDGKLRQIPIRLLSDDIEDVIQTAFVWYGGKTVGARSDGKTITWFNDPKNGKKLPEPIEEDFTPDMLDLKSSNGAPLLKAHSNFNCVIASHQSRYGGVYKFRTTSVISLRQLHASLVMLKQLTGGVLVGMPLTMVVRPMKVAPNGTATTVYVVHVEIRGGDMRELQQQALEMARFRLSFAAETRRNQLQYRKLLSAPGTESDGEAADVADEFAPDYSEIPTIEPEKPYGLLDEPVKPEAETKKSPPAPEPVQSPEEPAKDIDEIIADYIPGESESEPDAIPAKPDSAPEIDVSTWESTKAELVEAAIARNMPESELWAYVRAWLVKVGKVGKENRTTVEQRTMLVGAVVGGTLGKDGRICSGVD